MENLYPIFIAGCTWNSLVEGSPYAGFSTWNFYISSGSTQGSILFPRPVIVNSIRVSSGGSNVLTLSSAGNPDVSLTTSGNSPRTLVTGWTNPITSLTLRSSTGDQALDDLRLTTSSSGQGILPASQFQITIDHAAHQRYGLYYPVTYMFRIQRIRTT